MLLPLLVAVGAASVAWTVAPGGHACAVTGAGRSVPLGLHDTASASTAVASVLRAGGSPEELRDAARATLPGVGADDLRLVVDALTGRREAALSCGYDVPEVARERLGSSGLTPRAQRALDRLEAELGEQSLGGFAPGGVRTGHIPGSAHYDGRAIDIFFRPITEQNQRAGWTVAHWAVAHAAGLDVATVIYDRRIWTAQTGQWRTYHHPGGPTDNPILLHLDHVHVDVLAGS